MTHTAKKISIKSEQTPFYKIENEAIYWLESFHPEIPLEFIITDGKWHSLCNEKQKGKLGAPVYIAHKHDERGIIVTYSTLKGGGFTETWNSFDYFNNNKNYEQKINPITKFIAKEKQKAKEKQRAEFIANAKQKAKEEQKAKEIKLINQVNNYIEAQEVTKETKIRGYFESKQTADILYYINGARISKNGNIFIPLVDTNGDAGGYQIINENHKIIYGNLKENFTVIGDFSAKRIYFCEGIATGLSIYKALLKEGKLKKVCVVCAINAGNLEPVQRSIRKIYKTKNFIFCADNDAYHKDGRLKPYIKDNTGIVKSNKCALLHSLNWVTTPVINNNISTDFNDVHCEQGIDELIKQLSHITKPNPQIGYSREKFNLAKKQTDKGKRYLGQLNFNVGFNLVKSEIGTGKTTSLIPHVKESMSFLYISHLISLTTDASKKLNLENYLENQDIIHKFPHLAICINSLYKLVSMQGKCPNYQYVVIDEIEQLLRRLTNKMDNKSLILIALECILKSAEYIVFMDAKLGKLTRKFIKDLNIDKPIYNITNEYIGEERKIIIHENESTIHEQAIESLRNNKKVFITSNSKRETKKAHVNFKKKGFNGLLINSENTGDQEVIEFFKDPNNTIKKYQYLIVSPSVNTGVSIDSVNGKAVFDYIAGIFRAGINSPDDAIQALGRVRDAKTLNIFAARNGNREVPTEQEALEDIKRLARDVKKANKQGVFDIDWEITSNGKIELRNEMYSRLCARVIVQEKQGQNDFFGNLIFKFSMMNSSFSWIAKSSTATEVKKSINEAELLNHIEEITKASDISENEAKKLNQKNRPSQTDTNKMEKFNLKQFYGDQLTIEQIIKEDERGKLRTGLKKLFLATSSEFRLKILEQNQINNNTLDADLINHALEKKIALAVLNAVKINSNLESQEFIYTKESKEIQDLVTLFNENREEWKTVTAIPSLKYMRSNALSFISTQLKRLGLKQKRLGSNKKGQYFIDVERLNLARMAKKMQ